MDNGRNSNNNPKRKQGKRSSIMRAPQIIVLVLTGISLLQQAYLHGNPKKGRYNFFVAFISNICWLSLLWWGSFFK